MKTKYLSYAQAYALARDYQFITGQDLGQGLKADLITIAPYSRILQWSFVMHLVNHPGEAITIQNPTGRYDVIIVSGCKAAPGGFVVTELRSFLKTVQIPFEVEKYYNIRTQGPITEFTCQFELYED